MTRRREVKANSEKRWQGGVKNWDFYGDILFEWPHIPCYLEIFPSSLWFPTVLGNFSPPTKAEVELVLGMWKPNTVKIIVNQCPLNIHIFTEMCVCIFSFNSKLFTKYQSLKISTIIGNHQSYRNFRKRLTPFGPSVEKSWLGFSRGARIFNKISRRYLCTLHSRGMRDIPTYSARKNQFH